MLKVLIVDDERITRVALRSVMDWESHGYGIVGTAADGLGALRMIEDAQPDIIITDLVMPRMTGIELIERLVDDKYEGKIIVLSNYQDFDLVRQAMKLGAVDYLLKTSTNKEILLDLLEKTREAIEAERNQKRAERIRQFNHENNMQILAANMLKSFFCEPDFDIRKTAWEAKIELEIFKERFALLYLCIDRFEETVKGLEGKSPNLLISSIKNILMEMIKGISKTSIVDIGRGKLLLILTEGLCRDTGLKLLPLAREISDQLSIYLNIDVSVLFCEDFISLDRATEVYKRCMNASRKRFYTTGKIISPCVDVKFNELPSQIRYNNYINRILPLLGNKNIDKACVNFDEIINECKENNVFPEKLIELIAILLEGIRIELCREHDSKIDLLYTIKTIREKLDNIETVDELRTVIRQVLMDFTQALEKGKQKYRKEVADIIEYINNNIDSKLTLSMIAARVHMNETYMCRIFKSEVGKSVVQYITDIKMKKAMELIRAGNEYMKEVAAQVGIDDQFYFSRIFKKYYGASPSDYARKL